MKSCSTKNVTCDCFSMHIFFVLQTATALEVRGVTSIIYLVLVVWCHVIRYLFVEMILTVHFRLEQNNLVQCLVGLRLSWLGVILTSDYCLNGLIYFLKLKRKYSYLYFIFFITQIYGISYAIFIQKLLQNIQK